MSDAFLLTINAGSSSLEFALFRLGEEPSRAFAGKLVEHQRDIVAHGEALPEIRHGRWKGRAPAAARHGNDPT